MSSAAVLSTRGDTYQILVAMDWAITVLSEPDYQWIEVDSTTHPVDDVVVGKSDGSLICCQCKKNQTNFKSWTVRELKKLGELDKAAKELNGNLHKVQVRFYSRNGFGSLAKLKEYSTLQSNEADYIKHLTKEHTETNQELQNAIHTAAPNLSSYDFLRQTFFTITDDFDRMKSLLHERLRTISSNSKAAFDTLFKRIFELTARIEQDDLRASAQHRFTKQDLQEILKMAGATLAPAIDVNEVKRLFSRTSTVGRAWYRDIAERRVSSQIVNQLLDAIDSGKRSILLTGSAGSGKTCVMLDLQDALEQRTQTRQDLVPLFIQSREFSDCATTEERRDRGLPEQWIEKIARLAEECQMVVVIDSLDVLSIAREHNVLTYFLAQIDQLLNIPNVTVVTSCRDFDHKYDQRIAIRQWGCKLQCLPWEWESEVAPLLTDLGIDLDTIDKVTHELIRNPRELALFVELAQHEGNFNAVTSQALAQQYLETIVQSDPRLGDTAMAAIEAMANEMLKSRSLCILRQRFEASEEILKRLKSLNVIRDTHKRELTFGHQTLLDVLVVSSAIRKGFSLNEFIQGLPPVPFIRPSIRSFVAQLATGDRRNFRKQLRTVLTGDAAFHIRRLIAKSFAQQKPEEIDWLLIRELRNNHREVFQVIYTQASSIDWHYFWLERLVPALKEVQDADGMIAHIFRVEQWVNEDTARILELWTEALELYWLDRQRIAEWLGYILYKFKTENLSLVAPLLTKIAGMPIPENGYLGQAIARCVDIGALDDILLWQYISGDVSSEDIKEYKISDKLRCDSHEFGNNRADFLKHRMMKSTTLLNLVLNEVENWSQIKFKCYGKCLDGFLNRTSYRYSHSQVEHQLVDCESILFDALEQAILDHARKNSSWWTDNRQRLCLSDEIALRYFAVVALTKYPRCNLDVISRLLCDKSLLESKLRYEVGELIKFAFTDLDRDTQNQILSIIQTLHSDLETNDEFKGWALKHKAEYISIIPCCLRSVASQTVLSDCEKRYGSVVRQPDTYLWCGMEASPLKFQVFLESSDHGVIRLLRYYSNKQRKGNHSFLDGERLVGSKLRDAASRHPSRFLKLLVEHWLDISDSFKDDLIQGIAYYLKYSHGNSETHKEWTPLEKTDAPVLANLILEELERHPAYWSLKEATAETLNACAYVIQDKQNAARLVFWAISFSTIEEKSTAWGGSNPLLTAGINMKTGRVAEALMVLANNLQEHDSELPELLPSTLYGFAKNENPAIRALILIHLPYLQSRIPNLGWKLFDLATQDSKGLWKHAERCLYYAYHDNFSRVQPSLDQILREGDPEDMESWGRISALSALRGHIDFSSLLDELEQIERAEAWCGAVSVWTHTDNIKNCREQCLRGIEAGLQRENSCAESVALKMTDIFRKRVVPISIPLNLIQRCFDVCESSTNRQRGIFRFDEWLNVISQQDPDLALGAVEIYLGHIRRISQYHYDHKNMLVQLLTRLFEEAEEREESDRGEMLRRVVKLQDSLLSLGISSVNDWLEAAERQ